MVFRGKIDDKKEVRLERVRETRGCKGREGKDKACGNVLTEHTFYRKLARFSIR